MGLGRKEWAGVMGVRAGKGFGREVIDKGESLGLGEPRGKAKVGATVVTQSRTGGGKSRGGQGPAAGAGQGLTAVGVVPPAGRGGARLLADAGIPAEDLATQPLLLLGVAGGTQVRHTVPGGQQGQVGGCQTRGGRPGDPALQKRPWKPHQRVGRCAVGMCVHVCDKVLRTELCPTESQRTGHRSWIKGLGSPTHSRKGSGATVW